MGEENRGGLERDYLKCFKIIEVYILQGAF